MSTLVAMVFDSYVDAQRVRIEFAKMQREHLVELEDIVVVHRTAKGDVKLDQSVNLMASTAVAGGFWGALIGMLMLPFAGPAVPVISSLFGAGLGALSGKLSDYGLDDEMMKEVGAGLEVGKAALFVLERKATLDKVLEHLSKFDGKVLKTSLPNKLEEQLRDALEHPRRAEPAAGSYLTSHTHQG